MLQRSLKDHIKCAAAIRNRQDLGDVDADHGQREQGCGAAGGFEKGVDLVDAANDFVVLGFERVVDIFVEEDCIDFVAGELAAVDDQANENHEAEGPDNEHRGKYGH